jgi:hypothetical protein
LQGDDREGVRERQNEWSRWAESLPKVGLGEKTERERVTEMSRAETTQPRPIRPETEGAATTEISRPSASKRRKEAPNVGRSLARQSRSEPAYGGGKTKDTSLGEGSWAWTSVSPWKRYVRTAPGKADQDPDKHTKGPMRQEPS